MKNLLILSFVAIALAACGGGGGGAGSALNTPVDPDQVLYNNTYNEAIANGNTKAEAAAIAAIHTTHEQGIKGEGVKIAIVDGFSGQTSYHGEYVTNATGIIAPEALYVTIDIDDPTESNSKLDFDRITEEQDELILEADIVNLSVYSDGITLATIIDLDLISEFTGEDNLYVVAAGNDGGCLDSSGVDCNTLALILSQVESSDTNSIATIVVGALKDNYTELNSSREDLLEDYSNKAGVLMNDFIGALVIDQLNCPEGYVCTDEEGTSYAAPLVTGVAALIMDKWELDASETKALIFDTADDLGVEGIDDIYGNGALNIGRALSPVGDLN